jgi:replicative DNA helicase
MKGTSSELQEISLAGLMSDPYLLAKCSHEITEDFFSKSSYKLVYKNLCKFYNKYMAIPTKQEIIVSVQDSMKGYTKEDIDGTIEDINKLFNVKISSTDFLYSKIIEFIRRQKIESCLGKTVDYMQNKGEIDLDKLAVDLKDSISLSFSKSPVYNLSDISKIKEVREESLGSADRSLIIKCFIDPVNWCMQYNGLIPGTVNMIVAPPGSGKTTWLINQGISTAMQGFNVLHVFLGDMSNYDGLLRYASCLSGVPTSKLVNLTDEQLEAFIKKINMTGFLSHVYIAAYAAGELNAGQLIEEVSSMQKTLRVHFNMVIIDYDENLSKESDSMYESGGEVYNKVGLFSVLNKSVVFIAAQPKPEFWDAEIIPLKGAAESSKKQKIIDLMLTVGKPKKGSKVGTLFIAKNRRGQDQKAIRLLFTGENARVKAISEDQYATLRQERTETEVNNGK